MPYKVFWCKVNKYYLNLWIDFFHKLWNDLHDVMLIDTCVVTDKAKNKRLKEVKSAIKNGYKIMITGCGCFDRWNLIQLDKFYTLYPELKDYSKLITLLPESPNEFSDWYNLWDKSYEFKKWWNIQLSKNKLYTRHFLIIQNWCDNHCSFCLTVAKRWAHTSRPLEDIINEIKFIESQWWKEIVLTWINLAAWWCSSSVKYDETKFPMLLREILKQTSISRIRISSIWPEYANDEFFDVISDDRILPHFHYSVQSFSWNVLKNMRRHYSSEKLKNVLKRTRKLQRKDQNLISIGADIIVGFAWESEEDFMETYNWVAEFWITKLHAFPFSDHTQRDWIPASLFPNQIELNIKKERETRLISLWDKVRDDFIMKNKWSFHKVLIEEKKSWKWRWWTENYIQVDLVWNYNKWDIVDIVL